MSTRYVHFVHFNFAKINLQNKFLSEKLLKVHRVMRDEIRKHRKTFNLHKPDDVIDFYIEEKKKGADISGSLAKGALSVVSKVVRSRSIAIELTFAPPQINKR